MKKAFSLFAFALFTCTIFSQDLIVNGSGLPNTYGTISSAVEAASPGDQILVSNQSFPYFEDTLFINKDVTIMPFSDVAYINFTGDIKIELDDISNVTLIGFDSKDTEVHSVFNDTTRNSLSTINITDCNFHSIDLLHPKTSLNLSYSRIWNGLWFSHGNIVANHLNRVHFGYIDFNMFDENKTYFYDQSNNYFNNGSSAPTQCEFFEANKNFGDVSTFSDTTYIISNLFRSGWLSQSGNYNCSSRGNLALLSKDKPVHVFNNDLQKISIYNMCGPENGRNKIINNQLYENSEGYIKHYVLRCNDDEHNMKHINIDILNNSTEDSNSAYYFDNPYNYNYSAGSYNELFTTTGILGYNTRDYYYFENHNSWGEYAQGYQFNYNNPAENNNLVFLLGPEGGDNNPNPSPEFYNLDLTLNKIGYRGGSHAWSNYHNSSEPQCESTGFGELQGSKARITFLNLPTQIFSTDQIQIKAKAVHGN